MAKTLIENLAATWDPEKYHDRYRNEILDLLEKKAEGEPLPERQEETGGEVVDLMEALRQSVQATKRRRAASGSKKTSARKTASTRKKRTTTRKKSTARKAS
jgi:DNA end-binding protein Ku